MKVTTPAYKKGIMRYVANYRSIAVISNKRKIVDAAIAKKDKTQYSFDQCHIGSLSHVSTENTIISHISYVNQLQYLF